MSRCTVCEQVITDFWGQEWNLHATGPSTAPRRHGTGFLIGPEFEVVSFTALSPQVSWIKAKFRQERSARIRYGTIPRLGPLADGGTGCFVTGYAPTESNSSEDDMDGFYEHLHLALKEARKSGGNQHVPVMGD